MSRGGARHGAGRPRWHDRTTGKLRVDVHKLHRTDTWLAISG